MSSRLEQVIGYTFGTPAYLHRAMVHSSYCNEHRKEERESNERLEFLGDAVLELSASRYFYDSCPDEAEGQLSKRRAAAVCEPSLAHCAREIDLGGYLLLGKGEDATGGRDRDSVLSDALEALIGAIYLDGGFEAARRFAVRFILREMGKHPAYDDTKSRLQEMLQARGVREIEYRPVGEEGPDHDRRFSVALYLDGKFSSEGSGRSKKAAEQAAAAAELKKAAERSE